MRAKIAATMGMLVALLSSGTDALAWPDLSLQTQDGKVGIKFGLELQPQYQFLSIEGHGKTNGFQLRRAASHIKRRSTMKTRLVVLSMLCLLLAPFGCSRPSSSTVTLAGSTAFQPFAEKLAEHYLATHKDLKINVQGGGSAVGIQSALSGAANVGMADLLTLPPEAKDLKSTIVARDGIAIVVNPKNPISGLTLEQARDIFAGKISNWKDAGGADSPIHIISREEGSGTRRSFDKLVLGAAKLAPGALFQNSNGTCREAVASDALAIGYVSIGLVNEKVKALSLGGVHPTNDDVKKGNYPLARPVFFLTKGEPTEKAKAFIDYVLSPEGQGIIEKEGLIAAR